LFGYDNKNVEKKDNNNNSSPIKESIREIPRYESKNINELKNKYLLMARDMELSAKKILSSGRHSTFLRC